MGGDHHLVGLGARRDLLDPRAHLLRCADDHEAPVEFDHRLLLGSEDMRGDLVGARQPARSAGAELHEREHHRRRHPLRGLLGVGAKHGEREDGMRLRQAGRRQEAASVDAHRDVRRLGAEVTREGEPHADRAGELRAVVTRAEEEERRKRRVIRHGADGAERVTGRKFPAAERDEVVELLEEIVGRQRRARAPQRERGETVGPRRAADAEVDATGMQRLEEPIRLGDLEGRVIGQHHAPRAEPDARRDRAHMRDQDLGRGGGDAGHVVVLGVPEA